MKIEALELANTQANVVINFCITTIHRFIIDDDAIIQFNIIMKVSSDMRDVVVDCSSIIGKAASFCIETGIQFLHEKLHKWFQFANSSILNVIMLFLKEEWKMQMIWFQPN